MYYDVWKDSHGDLHILPSGTYRIIKHKSTGGMSLVPYEPSEGVDNTPVVFNITRGVLLKSEVRINLALSALLKEGTSE